MYTCRVTSMVQRSMFLVSVLWLQLSCQIAVGIPLSKFYPFGEDAGDLSLDRTLDGSSPLIKLASSVFPFYGQEYDQLFVNANGHISFLTQVGTYIPQPFPLQSLPLIAPFWADSDTQPEDGGRIWYRENNDSILLSTIQDTIRSSFLGVDSFSPHFMFIATWDHIGYYSMNTDRTNTFQCVLVTDGEISFVIFLYADGLIQWLWSEDHEGNPAEVGANAGDGIRFFRHPDSNTENLLNIASSSNVGMPGVWIVRTDREGLPVKECRNEPNVPISLTPRSGNMLGGTGVFVTGPCFSDNQIKCRFDQIDAKGVVVSESVLLCVTPVMTRIGAVTAEVIFSNKVYNSTFISITPERAYSVDFMPGKLVFDHDETRTITWSPDTIAPTNFYPNATNTITVDITLFRQELASYFPVEYKWMAQRLESNLPNDGQAIVKIPSTVFSCKYLTNVNLELKVCPVAFKVSISGKNSFAFPSGLGQWSGVGFLRASDASDMKLREACDKWSEGDQLLQSSRLSSLIPCPPTVRLAMFDPVYQEIRRISVVGNSRYHQDTMDLFHSNSDVCFNELVPQGSSGQECCYNEGGNLVKGPPGGGSADSMSPRVDYNSHLLTDLVPYLLCCTGNVANCDVYFSERPGGEEDNYRLPVPACIYGDPHIVTLDGLKYTFNGKGEFILIETEDNTFTLQGRMEPAKDINDISALGTVFTAIVAVQHETKTSVQFEIRTTGVKVSISGKGIDFDEMNEIKFSEVTLEDKGNATVVASFSKGTSIELKVENGIISVMLVSLPSYQKGMTRGLMGNFNGDPSDDLLPKGQSVPLPSDSSIEVIHHMFGMTWIVDDPSNSSFVYNPGDSFSTYFDPMFIPVFESKFNDSELEKEAKKICGEDKFCLFDIAATKRTEIGLSTMQGSENFEAILNSSEPILCDPHCANGACVEGNICECSQGFTGDRCHIPAMSECEENFCQNNGTCIKHVLTVTCSCEPGYVGAFCQDKEPPFFIQLINSSPRVSQNKLVVDFAPSKPITEAKCFLSGQDEQDCTSGYVYFESIPAATYVFRVVAKTGLGERAVVRRIVQIIGTDDEGSGEAIVCTVHLINEGILVHGNNVTAQFVGVGSAASYLCRLDSQLLKKCRSPIRYTNVAVGKHRIQIQPQGQGCVRQNRLSVKFQIK